MTALAVGCGSEDTSESPGASDATTPEASSPTGQQVTVVNDDDVAHTVTDRAGAFDVDVPAGASVTFRVPDQTGRLDYYCKYHANMTGTLDVA